MQEILDKPNYKVRPCFKEKKKKKKKEKLKIIKNKILYRLLPGSKGQPLWAKAGSDTYSKYTV